MKLGGFIGLLLLLWMESRVDGEDTISHFIRDVMTTFDLTSPTIIYDGGEQPPEICYTQEWVLCLASPIQENESKHSVNGTVKGDNNKEVSTEERNEESANNGKFIYKETTHSVLAKRRPILGS